MSKAKTATIEVQGAAITILSQKDQDFICLTDIAKRKEPDRADHVIQNWMRNRNTVECLGVWERLNNAGFNPLEFEGFRNRAGLNSFVLTPRQWIDATAAIGLISKSGRYGGGTYAHKDIAFEFASWISVEFRLYLIKEFQRLKDDESRRLSLAWNLNRTLSKAELPHPHRRGKGAPDSARSHARAGGHHLRERSGFAQRRALRSYRAAVAGRESQAGGKRPRLRERRAVAGAREHGRHERGVHSHGAGARRTAQAAQSNRHSSDAGIDLLEPEDIAWQKMIPA
jgi:hypothetical protein